MKHALVHYADRPTVNMKLFYFHFIVATYMCGFEFVEVFLIITSLHLQNQ